MEQLDCFEVVAHEDVENVRRRRTVFRSTILAISARNAAVTPGATFAWSAGSGKNRPIAPKVSGRQT
jgi:hypothetical protein